MEVNRNIPVIAASLLVAALVLSPVSAAESETEKGRSNTSETADYLRQEQWDREQQQLQDHRDAQREQSNARQQDLHDRIQQRRDDMIRDMNKKP